MSPTVGLLRARASHSDTRHYVAVRAVLITLVGPDRTVDLALDADTPVADLIPKLLDALVLDGSSDQSRWTLSPTGGAEFAPQMTLNDAQVLDGSILVLRRAVDQPATQSNAAPSTAVSGSVASGPPRAHARALLAALREPPETVIADCRLARCPTIAVVSPKGGVGKTTTSLLIGEAFARLRTEPVVALDADIDYGSLSRIGPQTAAPVFSELSEATLTFAELDRRLPRLPGGLRLVPAPTDPRAVAAIDRGAYTRAITATQSLTGVLLLDCGSGLGQPSVQASIMACDQIVLVTDTTASTLALAAESAALLIRTGRPITVICNRLPRRRAEATLASLEGLFAGAASLSGIPEDSGAAHVIGGEFDLATASKPLREAVLEAATLLALGWISLGLARPGNAS